MSAWSTASRRQQGQGVVVGLVIWVIAIALIYALSQGQAQSDALVGVVRVAGLRSVQWAGRSALNEVAFKLAGRPAGGEDPMERLQSGANPSPLDPAATKQVYQEQIARGELTIGEVEVKLIGGTRPPDSSDAWYFDASVKVDYRLGRSQLSRTVRRRLTGRRQFVTLTLGPGAPRTLGSPLVLNPGYLFEVLE